MAWSSVNRTPSTRRHFRRRALPSMSTLQRQSMDHHLRTIYEGPDGRFPDLTRLERRGRSPLRLFFVMIAGVGLLVGVAWAGRTYWGQQTERFGEELVEMHLRAPQEVRAGEAVGLKLQLVNRSSTTLNDVDVLLQYPEGFLPEKVEPQAQGTEQRRWRLGEIEGGSEKTIQIIGLLWGTQGQEVSVRASALFVPASLRATFRLSREARLKINDSTVALNVQKPESVAIGQSFTLSTKVTNSAATPLGGFILRIRPPEGLFVEFTEPKISQGNGLEWKDLTVPAGSETVVRVTAKFVAGTATSDQQGVKLIRINGILWRGSTEATIVQAEAPVILRASRMGMRLIVNGIGSSQSIALPEMLRLSLTLTNPSQEPLKNLVVRLDARSATEGRASGILWKRIEADGRPVVEREGIIWNPAAFKPLATLEPAKELIIDAILPLDRSIARGGTVLNITPSVTIPSPTGGEGAVETGTPLVLTLVERTEIQTRARYYDDDNIAVGSGPFPPKVGENTTLRIYWTLNPGSAALEDVRVVTSLPPNVSYSGSAHASVGNLKYDENARTMTWGINRLSNTSGSAAVDFGVTLKPGGADSGRALQLTGPTTLSSRDATDGSIVTRSVDALTTQLVDDPEFSDTSGVVRE